MTAPSLTLLVLALLGAGCAWADEPATERYAPVQLRVAKDFLEQAQASATLGERERAGRLAWQASLDARLAWGMSESPYLRAEAARVSGAASALITRLAAHR